MPLLFNIRHLEHHAVVLRGELHESDLDIGEVDELIRVLTPVKHDLAIELFDGGYLVQGSLKLMLRCECARCLKPFDHRLELKDWSCLLPMEGEDKVLIHNDCVDLTPYVREDILLAFPQHPLCDPKCSGLTGRSRFKSNPSTSAGSTKQQPSPWAELNKLKL